MISKTLVLYIFVLKLPPHANSSEFTNKKNFVHKSGLSSFGILIAYNFTLMSIYLSHQIIIKRSKRTSREVEEKGISSEEGQTYIGKGKGEKEEGRNYEN